MVNKLSAIRNKKDRAEEEYSESLRGVVVELRRQNPMWTLQTIANVMNVSRERIRQLLKSENMPTAAVKELSVVVLTCDSCGVTFERPSRVHLYNQGQGVVTTYCGSVCQRKGLSKWQRQKTLTRTECSKGHLITPANVVTSTATSATGRVYRARRCRTCRNAYARDYYRRKKQAETLVYLQNLVEEVRADGNGTE